MHIVTLVATAKVVGLQELSSRDVWIRMLAFWVNRPIGLNYLLLLDFSL